MNKRLQLFKYLAADYAAAFFTWVAFYVFRLININLNPEGSDVWSFYTTDAFYLGLLLVPFFWLFVHYLSGYYVQLFRKSRLSEFFTTLYSSVIGSLILFFIIVIDDLQTLPETNYKYFYQAFLTLVAIQFLSTYLLRFIITQRNTSRIHHRKLSFNTLIIGTGKNAQMLAEKLEKMRLSLGNKIVGFVALEDIGDLENLVKKHSVQEVIFCPEKEDNNLMFRSLGMLNKYDIEVKYLPNIDKLVTGKWQVSTIYAVPLVSISGDPMPDWQKSFKRVIDIITSFSALVLLSPFFALLAVLIKKDSKGNVFFRQERLGKHGKPFQICKFRTMRSDAESDGVPRLSSTTDRRVTRLGRFLRKYRIDELPQFWNVLKGEMSLVGPRPERQYFIKQIVKRAPYYYLVQRVQPGITSWGMVKYGYADSVGKMIDRLEYEIIYVENKSLLIDLKILIYTVKTIVTGKGI
ncbi:MAG: sugar transferase [Prevotellaceae bacterium]|jgi:exopolysaccharide biosynthesis polyprenyl glycosylphosphotransferase|nr:sugar transferase [Prevotellaceae bacterium]